MLTKNNPMCIPMTMQMPMSPPRVQRLLARAPENGLSSVPPSQLSKPVRPLTAYHLFFQLEREYILQTPTDNDAANQGQVQIDKRRIGKDIDDDMPSRYQLIHFNDEWYKSASGKRSSNKNQPKRKHRKTHGKIGFLELSSVISKRWHQLAELDPETKSFVAKVASRLLEVYKRDMAEFKAQSMARMSTTTTPLFPVMSTSFEPHMSYIPQAPGTYHYPTTYYSPPPDLPPCEAKKLPCPTTFGVDFDQVLREEPISFKTDQQSEEKEKELDPLSGFTFYPVSRHDYMKRKRADKEDRHSKRSRHSSYVDGRTRKTQIESEKDILKMGIRAMREQMWNERSTQSPPRDDYYRTPCPITPAAEGSDMMCPVDAEDLMKALQGSELFA